MGVVDGYEGTAVMACGSCGGKRAKGAEQEYLVTYRAGGTATAPDLITVRQLLANNGGGTYKLVTKTVK